MFAAPFFPESPMPIFNLRYDLRCAPFDSTTSAELAATALDQCEWADRLGFASVTLSEHHGSPDGYLPSPLVFGAAVAARTKNLRLVIAALIAPLHDPIRLAEDIAVLDVVSGGRVIPVVSGGYVESEFRTFGKRLSDRARVMEGIVPLLERAWSGEPFEHNGVTVRVTPRPVQRPRPPIFMGGASEVAARRAARYADHFIPTLPQFYPIYREERVKLGKPDPGPLSHGTGNYLYLAEDPDAAWPRIAPYAMHEMNAYGKWMTEAGAAGPYQPIRDADALRATGQYKVMTPDELIEIARGMGPLDAILFHPLMGGMNPELSWASLRLFEAKVLPALRS
jgi:alkanesulfonate monooxygenase SsuD/methylene tetrahydromethanopterin reductase-like flavin-dependent oxidoreductase (luciferase family)